MFWLNRAGFELIVTLLSAHRDLFADLLGVVSEELAIYPERDAMIPIPSNFPQNNSHRVALFHEPAPRDDFDRLEELTANALRAARNACEMIAQVVFDRRQAANIAELRQAVEQRRLLNDRFVETARAIHNDLEQADRSELIGLSVGQVTQDLRDAISLSNRMRDLLAAERNVGWHRGIFVNKLQFSFRSETRPCWNFRQVFSLFCPTQFLEFPNRLTSSVQPPGRQLPLLTRIPLMTTQTTAASANKPRTHNSVEVFVGLLAKRYIATLIAANDNCAPRSERDT